MDEQNQKIKLYHTCGHEKVYDNYHRMYAACKKCASKRCAEYYQRNREKLLEKSRQYREINKDKFKRNRQTFVSHTEDIQNLYNQINALTEILKNKVSVS